MKDFIPPTDEELACLMKANDVADIMAITVPDAELSFAVQRAQNNDVFRTAVNSVHELGIPRAHFVAVHTLATCAGAIEKLPEQHGPDDLRAFLFELALEILGEEHESRLKGYMRGATADATSDGDDTWYRMGAIVSNLTKLKSTACAQESAHAASIINSCGNMGAGLNALRDRMLSQPEEEPRKMAGSAYVPTAP